MKGVIVVPTVAMKRIDVRAREVDLRLDDPAADGTPVRVREDRGDRIGEERDRHRHEDPLCELVRATHDEEPDHDGCDGNRDLHRHACESERRAYPDELRDGDPNVREQDGEGREERPARPVLLADQLGEAFARDGAHPRRHLLHDDEADRDQHHHPEKVVAVPRADRGVRGDAARVVARIRGDEPRSDKGEERDQRDREPAPRAQPGAAAGQARQAEPEHHVSRSRGARSGGARARAGPARARRRL